MTDDDQPRPWSRPEDGDDQSRGTDWTPPATQRARHQAEGYEPGQRICGYIHFRPEDDPDADSTRICLRLEGECTLHPRAVRWPGDAVGPADVVMSDGVGEPPESDTYLWHAAEAEKLLRVASEMSGNTHAAFGASYVARAHAHATLAAAAATREHVAWLEGQR